MRDTLLIPTQTLACITAYRTALRSGDAKPGTRLQNSLSAEGLDLAVLSDKEFLSLLLNTKSPQIFAESEVAGDGSDWNLTELGILGDLSIAVPVTIFDNAHHTAPIPHAEPFPGTLIFTPGALLRNGCGCPPADWDEVTEGSGQIQAEGYYGLYERRLLPVFQHVESTAALQNKPALLTIPGLGCGQFAGPFRGQLGAALQTVLERFLQHHGPSFPNLKIVYFDPYSECANHADQIHDISFRVRPLLQGNSGKTQLCHPSSYEEPGEDLSDHLLFSIVAWDHVSWPGNDFFVGSRCTDDGVKAAATNSMAVLTGIEGTYHPQRGAYLPPTPYRTWGDVVRQNRLKLRTEIPHSTSPGSGAPDRPLFHI
jgi:hypothetical protein